MKYYIAIFLFLVAVIYGRAQDSAVHLSPEMFDENQVITLFKLDAWRFRHGHDSACASPGINTTGWGKMKPAQITKKDNGNGNGIPKKVVDKIFQTFFTTKPAGEGTGLGLSLAYDIVKAHGGELKVETKEGEGAEFIIRLPI